jgi:hypothetical protein
MEVNMTNQRKRVHWLLFPFWLLWRLVVWIVEATGRLIGAILGLVLMIVGIILSLTVVGAIVGIPLTVLGFLLTIRSLF